MHWKACLSCDCGEHEHHPLDAFLSKIGVADAVPKRVTVRSTRGAPHAGVAARGKGVGGRDKGEEEGGGKVSVTTSHKWNQDILVEDKPYEVYTEQLGNTEDTQIAMALIKADAVLLATSARPSSVPLDLISHAPAFDAYASVYNAGLSG